MIKKKFFNIIDLGASKIRFSVFDKDFNEKYFKSRSVKLQRENSDYFDILEDIIKETEKKISSHIQDVILIFDPLKLLTIEISLSKNLGGGAKLLKVYNSLILELNQIINTNYSNYSRAHILLDSCIVDKKIFNELPKHKKEIKDIKADFKIICFSKKVIKFLKNDFNKININVTNFFCASYVKTLGLIDKLSISGNFAFIDIGFKKSSILIFNDKKLLYINNIRIGGDSVTKDISKILNLDYRHAEAEKLKFSKTNKIESNLENNSLVRSIINSRLEEIVELLFLDCPLIDSDLKNNKLKLYFTGNGSKVLNENLLSFGPEFNFISDMSIIVEEKMHCCNSAFAYSTNIENIQPLKSNRILENKGFFEKLFEFFSLK